MHQPAFSIRKMVSLALLTAGLSACNNGDDGLLGGPSTPENTAPQALNVAVQGHITAPEATRSNVTTTLQLTGDYFDAESDVADTHEFRWKKNGVVIEGANSSKLVLNSEAELLDAEFVGCVTPIAKTGVRRGLEVCAPASNDNSPAVPPGTPVPAAQPTITGDPKVGETIKSRYTYAPNGTVAGSTEGSSEFGWLIYRDPSLPSWKTCLAGAEVDCNYTVDAADKDKTIYSCVQPRNQLGVWGAVRCDSTNAYNNVAPELRNAVIWGVVQNGVTLTASAQYFDQDGDQADSEAIVQSVRWLRRDADGNETQVATGSTTYKVTGAVEGAVFKACATPYSIVPSDKPYVVRQGIEVCTTTSVGNPDNPGQPPVVLPPNSPTPLATPTISGTPLQGRTIQATYSYDANVQQGQDGTNSSEDPAKSQFAWLVENASGLFELQKPVCTAGAGSSCELTVTNAMVGKKLKACVLPANQLGAYGPIACTDVAGIGLTITGSLEYGKNLVGTVFGVSGTATWRVDTSNENGFNNDTNPTQVLEKLAEDVVPSQTVTYTIGLTEYLRAQGMQDTNNNGVIDDTDWNATENDAVRPSISAANYIGKDVHFCVTSEPYGDICVNASSFAYLNDGNKCNNERLCVVDGAYQTNALRLPLNPDWDVPVNTSQLYYTGRVGINLPREIKLNNGVTHYRPISASDVLDINLQGTKLDYFHIVSTDNPGQPIIYGHYGEEYAAYPLGDSMAVDACHLVVSNSAFVPVSGRLGYISDDLLAFGNNAAEDISASSHELANLIQGEKIEGYQVSSSFGWPLSWRYVTSSMQTPPDTWFIEVFHPYPFSDALSIATYNPMGNLICTSKK